MATESELLRAYNDSAAKAGAGAAQNAQPTQTTQNTPAMQSAAQYPQGTQGTQTAETPTQTPQAPAADAAGGAADTAGNGGYNNNVVNGAYNTARMDAINQMYDAQRAAREAELKNAYDQSMSAYQEAQGKIAPEYQQKANDLGVQYERQRHNFWNQAAASGINTGVSAQESLARGGEYQRDFGALRTSEAEQQAAVERQMADRKAQYQNDVAAALAENDYQRAGALLDEYNNGYSRDLENAKLLASYGDFTFFENLYGKDQANNMFLLWASQNPDLAHNTGRITDDQFRNIKAGKSMNDGLDENGKRIISAAAAAAASGGGNNYFGITGGGWDPGNHSDYWKNIQNLVSTAHENGGHVGSFG